MIRVIFLVIVCALYNWVYAQTSTIEYKAIQVESPLTLALGTLTTSRVCHDVRLPENLKSWSYRVTAYISQEQIAQAEKQAKTFSTLTRLVDVTGVTESIFNSVAIPGGSASVDVFLIDASHKEEFKDALTGEYNYYPLGSQENVNQHEFEIKGLTEGNYSICVRNPSYKIDVYVLIEIFAVVISEREQTQEESQAMTLGNLAWKAFEREEYDKCIDLSKKACELDNSLGFVHFNIALSYLIKGQTVEATQEYTRAISIAEKASNPKDTFKGAINDINTYMEKFPSKTDAQDILELLTEKAARYD